MSQEHLTLLELLGLEYAPIRPEEPHDLDAAIAWRSAPGAAWKLLLAAHHAPLDQFVRFLADVTLRHVNEASPVAFRETAVTFKAWCETVHHQDGDWAGWYADPHGHGIERDDPNLQDVVMGEEAHALLDLRLSLWSHIHHDCASLAREIGATFDFEVIRKVVVR